ncbi:MAG: right-handed parallel beta-helix repeat-containing protein [Clostridia bacterium]|nr:right-handed parallel beta-helix repeat-containing protein [Clostridia bacterium]
MKLFKRVLVLIFVVAVIAGALAYAVVRPVALPAKREILYEDVPKENPLRVATEVNGVSGSRFFIQSPKTEAYATVNVSRFGANPNKKDNTKPLNYAFNYCKNHPGTRLVFAKGVYYVSGHLQIEDLTDVCIDGNGAKIVYDYRRSLIDIEDCECLELKDLTIDWNWDTIPLGALARAVDVEGQKNTVDFIFDVPEYAREEMLYAITQCDEETGVYGAKGTMIETYEGQNPKVIKQVTRISDNTLRVVHDGSLARFGGNKFILRSNAYGGSVCNIRRCRDLTIDGVNLYGGTGMGFIIGERTSHFALRNLFIGPDPEYADVRCVSLDADAIHINDADGCFVIEGCDISKQGDDDVNINSGIGIIESVKGNTVTISADGSMSTEPGDVIAFRDKKFRLLDYTAVVESSESIGYKRRTITFRDKLPANIRKGATLFNAECTGNNYVIRNNYFHEHRARGLLLQTSDGLVENNTFYKTCHNALRIVMDITDGYWNEGTCADNIEIRNNTFIECGVIGTELIEIGTHINGKNSRAKVFTNIRITNNEFRGVYGNLMVVNNVNNFIFKNNTITLGDVYRRDVGQGRSYLIRDCANVDFSDNDYTDAPPFSFTKIIRSDNPFVWARLNLHRKGGKK